MQGVHLFRHYVELDAPRSAADGNPLPNPRQVSVSFFRQTSSPHRQCSLMVAQWAQFIYEDIVHVPGAKGATLQPLACCDRRANHPECLPIQISSQDPVYQGSVTCLPYARSTPSPKDNCLLGPRDQANLATSFVDGSMIYGSSNDKANNLRSFQGGLCASTQFIFVKNIQQIFA